MCLDEQNESQQPVSYSRLAIVFTIEVVYAHMIKMGILYRTTVILKYVYGTCEKRDFAKKIFNSMLISVEP